MAYQFKLQVPISEELNKKLKKKAKETGLGSVNDIVRVLLTNFANGNLSLSFTEKPQQNDLEDLATIIAKGIAEFQACKTKALDFSKPLHDQLLEE